ncbi:MAG: GreA/GreB family elongation factor [Cyclobacteriaceae bacterium]|nr:GreA/GreB family elongation factor [Cyclobacteriaceae bacterium]
MKLRSKLFEYCLQVVEERIKRMQLEIRQLQLSANTETKSSAGDKYETGRAMTQLEIERSTQQLAEVEKLHRRLQELRTAQITNAVVPGSMVTTTKGVFFISISLGQIEYDHTKYFCISADAPIAKALMGRGAGEKVSFQGKTYFILSIE